MDVLWNKQREKLEREARKAIMDLFGHTGCDTFKVPLTPGQRDKYICVTVEAEKKHDHVAGTTIGKDIDECARCGHDIRHSIHGPRL